MQIETPLEIPFEDLPLWMRRARQRVDWGLLLVVVFSLCVGWSFLFQQGVSGYNASVNYAFQSADIADTLREGWLYPRWSPHAFGGYGAPIAHYYPPGAPYGVALVEVLFTNDTATALRVVYIAALITAGAAVYAVVGRWTNAGGGMIAALLYLFCPYVGFVAPHIQGDLPVVFTFALIPALLWAVNRLVLLNTPTDFVLVSAITAALVFTDPRALLPALPMVVTLCALHVLTTSDKRMLLRVFAATAIGGVLASIYWLPALAEYNQVRWQSPAVHPPRYTLDLSQLFMPFQQPDPAELAPAPVFTLGWLLRVFLLLAIASVVLLRQRIQVYPIAFFVLGIILTTTTLILAPGATWMLGSIALCFSITGSAALSLETRLPSRLTRSMLPALLAVILIGSINVWLAPINVQTARSFHPVDQIRYEQQGAGVAVLPPGAWVPTTLMPGVEPNLSLLNSYQFTGSSPDTASRCSLCPLEKILPPQIARSGQINIISQQTHSAHYQVQTLGDCAGIQQPAPGCRLDQPLIMNWQTAYFPGWEAWLDDLKLDVRQSPLTGLIDIRLPRTSNRELTIVLTSTSVRDAGAVLTALSALILVLVLRQRVRTAVEPDRDFPLLTIEQTRLIFVLMISFGIIFALTALPNAPLKLRPRINSGLADIDLINIQTDVGLQLFGYRLADTLFQPGNTVDLSLYWRALRVLPDNYRVRVSLFDVNRTIEWARQPVRDPAGLPARRWTTSGYIADHYRIALPEDILPGSYQIMLEAYRCEVETECETSNRLTFFNPADRQPVKTLLLPPVITIIRG
jgi:hypothetical protein